MPVDVQALPAITHQAERLIELGLHALAGLDADDVRTGAKALGSAAGLLVVHPDRLAASALVPVVQVEGRSAFVVTDMQDLDAFTPIPDAAPPAGDLYVLHHLDRGDDMQNWSPEEALVAVRGSGRTPLTLAEGLHWLLQQPDVLERNSCFMTIGSRLRKPSGALDARTPALWFSNGTGRDGRERRHAPKVGWCWAGNRHTWLGFATASGRTPLRHAAPALARVQPAD